MSAMQCYEELTEIMHRTAGEVPSDGGWRSGNDHAKSCPTIKGGKNSAFCNKIFVWDGGILTRRFCKFTSNVVSSVKTTHNNNKNYRSHSRKGKEQHWPFLAIIMLLACVRFPNSLVIIFHFAKKSLL
jgi:hypothetical protein